MNLVETHCHLTDLGDEDIKEKIENALNASVTKLLCIGAGVGETPQQTAMEIAKKYEQVWFSAGIHPHDAYKEISASDFLEISSHEKCLAIGETGLDFFRDWSPFEEQRRIFQESIFLAKELNKPLIIHSRDAFNECYKYLKELSADKVGGVFHCYSGTAEQAKKLADINFLVSLTGIITFKNANDLRDQITKIPLKQIMLETDCPYMAAEPHRGKPSEPAHVKIIAEKLAEIHQVSIEEVAKVTSENAKKLFGI